MSPAYLLSHYDSTLPHISGKDNCSIEQLIAYLEENTFEENSTCAVLKELNLRLLIQQHFINNEDDCNSFLASPAYRFMNALRPNEKALDKDKLKQRTIFKCQQYVSHANPNPNSTYLSNYRRHENSNPYSEYNTPLHDACFDLISPYEQRYDFSNLEDEYACLQTQSFNNTPLNLACKTGNSYFAKLLVTKHKECNVGVNQPDSKGMTPLHWACFYRDNNLIDVLIKAGADTSAKNSYEQTPLDFYQNQIPLNISIRTTRDVLCHPSISDPLIVADVICENNNRLMSNTPLKEKELHPGALVDIIFHMDIIAFNQLNVPAEILAQELENAQDFIKNGNGNFDVNRSFKIFNYHHFSDVIHARNESPCSIEIESALHPRTSFTKTFFAAIILVLNQFVEYILSLLPPDTFMTPRAFVA